VRANRDLVQITRENPIRHLFNARERDRWVVAQNPFLQYSEGSMRPTVQGHARVPDSAHLAGGVRPPWACGESLSRLSRRYCPLLLPVGMRRGLEQEERIEKPNQRKVPSTLSCCPALQR
jgi:hypothetical protein